MKIIQIRLSYFIAGLVIGIFTILSITFVSAHGGDTSLVHACIRNNTLLPGAANVRIVGENVECNNNETAVDWPKTSSSGGSSLVVLDSQALEVGKLLDYLRAVRKFGDYWVSMEMTSSGLSKVDSFYVVYESSDCTGTPFIGTSGIVKNGIIVDDAIYYPGDPEISHYSSSQEFTPPGTYGECIEEEEPIDNISGPMESSLLPDFETPFSISEQ